MWYWLSRVLACYSFLLLIATTHAQDGVATERRISAKFEVTHSDGSPYTGTLTLQTAANDVVYLYTNRFGLGFAQLLPKEKYSVSTEDFPQFSHFETIASSQGVMEIEITLPPAALKGKSAKEGYGLVLFSYLDERGNPVTNRLLYCKADNGEFYTGLTNAAGKARVEVPLGHTYFFSVDGIPKFDSHTFTSYPPLQTAEIKLELNKVVVTKHSTPTQKKVAQSTNKERSQNQNKKTVYRTHTDSLRGARKRIQPPLAERQPAVFALPPREAVTSTPKVTKRILDGVYMLREVVEDAQKQNGNFLHTSRLHLLRTLLRKEYDSAVYVMDVTCSMDAYIEEYLLWLSLANHCDKIYGGVFFNDGDGLSDSSKVDGKTGGIHLASNNMDSITSTLVNAISYGCSGDDPENDLEALLFASQHYPKAKQLILIADNSSAVRDMSLLPQLHKPVHIILCASNPLGENNPPHEDYVNIALATNGSICSLNEELTLLKDELSPDRVSVGRWQYRKLKDRFIRIKQ